MNSPCMNCSKRVIGCHSTCKEYTEFRKDCDKMNEHRRNLRELYKYKTEVMRRIYGSGG